MLGFLRSRLDEEQMLMQQRKAVNGILRWVDSQDEEVKVTGSTSQAQTGEHLDWVRIAMNCRANKHKLLTDCHHCDLRFFSTSIVRYPIICSTGST